MIDNIKFYRSFICVSYEYEHVSKSTNQNGQKTWNLNLNLNLNLKQIPKIHNIPEKKTINKRERAGSVNGEIRTRRELSLARSVFKCGRRPLYRGRSSLRDEVGGGRARPGPAGGRAAQERGWSFDRYRAAGLASGAQWSSSCRPSSPNLPFLICLPRILRTRRKGCWVRRCDGGLDQCACHTLPAAGMGWRLRGGPIKGFRIRKWKDGC